MDLRATAAEHSRQNLGINTLTERKRTTRITKRDPDGQLVNGDVCRTERRPQPVAILPDTLRQLSSVTQPFLRGRSISPAARHDRQQQHERATRRQHFLEVSTWLRPLACHLLFSPGGCLLGIRKMT